MALKSREIGAAHWDAALTLEFADSRPAVAAVEIAPAPDTTTVFLAGDSTVTDQTSEPYSSWGQMLPRFFAPDIAVANHAESGESLRSFVAERRFEKIFDLIKPGDYLFLQFAHNDQKLGSDTAPYEALLRSVVADTRERGAVPVLVTSMQRRRFDSRGSIVDSLAAFRTPCAAWRRQEGVALVDLEPASRRFYEALGPERSKRAFVHYPAGTFPGQAAELKDDTHFNDYGAYQLARAIVEGIKIAGLGLASRLAADVAPFDPARPDSLDAWSLPASPSSRPGGGLGSVFCRRRQRGRRCCSSATRPCRRHGGAARVGHGHRALLRRREDPRREPRARRTQQPHVPDRGALGPGAEGDEARRLRAHPVRPQRRRVAQHRAARAARCRASATRRRTS